jgi:hypothetical protein
MLTDMAQREFPTVIRFSGWRDYFAISMLTLNAILSIFMRETENDATRKKQSRLRVAESDRDASPWTFMVGEVVMSQRGKMMEFQSWKS